MTKFEIRKSKFVEFEPIELGAVQDFKDLVVWQLARPLRSRIYMLAKKLPAEERYALNTQIRRAAQSIGANIAEGFGRYSYRENIQFCRQARGSCFELRDHLVTALDAGFRPEAEYSEVEALAQRVIQTLNGYIRSTNKTLVDARRDA
jgi:four helix bundle protein